VRAFNEQIVKLLNDECNGEPIHFVGLGGFDFQVAFGAVRRIQTETRAEFFLRGRAYEWNEGPTELPVWLVIGQVPQRFELPTSLILRMCLASGDFVDFFTDEEPYEAAIVEFEPRGDGIVMEVF